MWVNKKCTTLTFFAYTGVHIWSFSIDPHSNCGPVCCSQIYNTVGFLNDSLYLLNIVTLSGWLGESKNGGYFSWCPIIFEVLISVFNNTMCWNITKNNRNCWVWLPSKKMWITRNALHWRFMKNICKSKLQWSSLEKKIVCLFFTLQINNYGDDDE